jgi:hypothetical protein
MRILQFESQNFASVFALKTGLVIVAIASVKQNYLCDSFLLLLLCMHVFFLTLKQVPSHNKK